MSNAIQFTVRSRKATPSFGPPPPASAFTTEPDRAPSVSKPASVNPIPLPDFPAGVDLSTPLLLRNVLPDVAAAVGDIAKYRADHACRPMQSTFADYERMPVEDFGTAMLAGMGWSKGTPIGLSNPQVVEPIEYIRRGERLGLGAQPAPEILEMPSMTGRKRKKNGKESELVDPKTGRTRHVKGLDEVLVEKGRSIQAGDKVHIDKGCHDELTGVVTSVSDRDGTAEVILDSTRRPVRVPISHLSKRVNAQDNTAMHDSHHHRSRRRDVPLKWVVPGITIRIIDKAHKWYNCKGRVYDVASRTHFTVMIEGALIEDLTEYDVETVVADRPGLRLLCVAGPYKGQCCTLYRRMVDRGKAKVDLDNGDRVKCDLDHVTEFANNKN
uniref:G-patch domain-containing protein n=2 Tax=Spongospora subterranea TaxID=70186 RepID=A0A0H5R9A1_9EUKA|eukprot:CRZ10341.1 hypothetical protein [Spongospora subterranea]